MDELALDISQTERTASAIVYDQLRADILSARLEPGSVLDERLLAQRFGFSRSPIREALVRLWAEQLVQTLANRTSIVAPFDVVTLPSYLVARDFVYRLGARLAAQRRTDIDLARIEAALLAGEAAHDLNSYVEGNRRFHLTIAEAARMPILRQWTREVLDRGQRVLALVASREAATGGLHKMGDQDGHEAILAAIRAGDAATAEEAAGIDASTLGELVAEALTQAAIVSLPKALHA